MSNAARIVADSVSPDGVRLTTFIVTFWRGVLAELNTHRTFCLAGDTELEFDLPGGAREGAHKRVYRMRLDEFVDKWNNGARRVGANPKREVDLSWLVVDKFYPAHEVAARLGFATPSSIHALCRSGVLRSRRDADGRTWLVEGGSVITWRKSKPEHTRFDMRVKLGAMRIRQLNEQTGDVQTSHVVDAVYSGTKPVYEVAAGDFTVAGSLDHRVLTTEGWKTIRDLTTDDFLVVRKFGKREDEKLDPLRLKKIDGRWRSVFQRHERERLQKEDPLCRRCRVNRGDQIHHLVPVYQEPARAFDQTNVVLLCEPCHDVMHVEQDWQGGTYLYGSAAKVESIELRGEEPTFDLTIAGDFPNFFANGVVVHNSRNSASSRAIPVKKMIQMVMDNPYIPESWGKNQKGMQAEEEVSGQDAEQARLEWLLARDHAVTRAKALLGIGIHKQITNRLLEPFMYHTAIVTSTEWSNFFHLRDNPMAHPAIAEPARMMRELYEASTPEELGNGAGDWHLPLIQPQDWDWSAFSHLSSEELCNRMIKISVGRCARVSYLTHDGKRDLQADIDLYDRLLTSGHMSPFEHVARPAHGSDWQLSMAHWSEMVFSNDGGWQRPEPPNMWFGNLKGWCQYRKTIPGEADILAPKTE